MPGQGVGVAAIDRDELRRRVAEKYATVATNPELGFHFHTGAPLARMLGYPEEVLARIPARSLDSFAGTGNPFLFGNLRPGEEVVDVGCGAGLDTLIAAEQVAPGKVTAVDMTPEMRERTEASVRELGLTNVDVRAGFAEELPLPSESVDVVISNGVVNLCPDKQAVFAEMYRVLRPGGRIQIGDILVHREVPEEAKNDIDLWSG